MLRRQGFSRPDVNALANFTFLTQATNLLVSDRDPSMYLEEIAQKQPGALESHWIPMDRALWKVERYQDFLAARRDLLAMAANKFLDSLVAGSLPEQPAATSLPQQREAVTVGGGVGSEEEEKALFECSRWVIEQGLPDGELMHELADPTTGEPLAVLDLAWPNGLQEGYSVPVALLLDEGQETEEIANRMGYRYFTNVSDFKEYVQREVLAVEGEADTRLTDAAIPQS